MLRFKGGGAVCLSRKVGSVFSEVSHEFVKMATSQEFESTRVMVMKCHVSKMIWLEGSFYSPKSLLVFCLRSHLPLKTDIYPS